MEEQYRTEAALRPAFGSCMWLTVAEYDELATTAQPLLSVVRTLADALIL